MSHLWSRAVWWSLLLFEGTILRGVVYTRAVWWKTRENERVLHILNPTKSCTRAVWWKMGIFNYNNPTFDVIPV